MIRAVLDTNILVSAAITPKGHCDQIVAQAEAGAFSWLTSEFILTELTNVLGRKHIQSKYKSQVTARKRKRYISAIRAFAEVVPVVTVVSAVRDDPKDNPILACAKDGQADYIVSGDPHLCKLGTFEGIKIVAANEFLNDLKSQ